MTLDWKNLPSGPYVLKASVKDNQGKEVTADTNTILFSVEDKRPPVETTMWFYGANTEFDAAHPAVFCFGCWRARRLICQIRLYVSSIHIGKVMGMVSL